MELLEGQTLLRKTKEEVSADDALKDKEIIGFYFSAHWCPPCRAFTPVLAEFYETLVSDGKPFEVIFVSFDKSPEALFDYMNECHGNWLALPHGSALAEKMRDNFGFRGIPTLVIVKKDGTVITKAARQDVEAKGPRVYTEWSK